MEKILTIPETYPVGTILEAKVNMQTGNTSMTPYKQTKPNPGNYTILKGNRFRVFDHTNKRGYFEMLALNVDGCNPGPAIAIGNNQLSFFKKVD